MTTVGLVAIVLGALLIYEAIKAASARATAGGGGSSTSSPGSVPSLTAPTGSSGTSGANPVGPPVANLAELTAKAKQAGFSGNALQTVVAIALRESGGNPNIGGDYLGSGHIGLLQLSNELRSLYHIADPTNIFQQFQVAFSQFQKRGGFLDWGGWTEQCPGGPTPIPVPTSPSTVIQCGGSPVPLPPDFYQVVR